MVAASGEHSSQISASMRIAVGWAFRILLGRLPENEDVVTMYARMDSIDALAREIMRSPEFALRHPSFGRSWGNLPFESQFVITELVDGTKFWVNMLDGYVSRAIHSGDYEPNESSFIKSFLKPGMSALDIGANLGWFTVMMSKLLGPKGAVVAFEPRADLFKYLAKTILENKLKNVKLFNCALGSEQTNALLRWDPSGVNPGGTQLSPKGVSLDGMASSTVEMKRLDDIVTDAVDFIKIDVEGAEKIVFEGASKLLAKSRPTILAELSPDSLSQVSKVSFSDYMLFLKSIGYSAHLLKNDGCIGEKIVQWTFANDALVSAVLVPLT